MMEKASKEVLHFGFNQNNSRVPPLQIVDVLGCFYVVTSETFFIYNTNPVSLLRERCNSSKCTPPFKSARQPLSFWDYFHVQGLRLRLMGI